MDLSEEGLGRLHLGIFYQLVFEGVGVITFFLRQLKFQFSPIRSVHCKFNLSECTFCRLLFKLIRNKLFKLVKEKAFVSDLMTYLGHFETIILFALPQL